MRGLCCGKILLWRMNSIVTNAITLLFEIKLKNIMEIPMIFIQPVNCLAENKVQDYWKK